MIDRQRPRPQGEWHQWRCKRSARVMARGGRVNPGHGVTVEYDASAAWARTAWARTAWARATWARATWARAVGTRKRAVWQYCQIPVVELESRALTPW